MFHSRRSKFSQIPEMNLRTLNPVRNITYDFHIKKSKPIFEVTLCSKLDDNPCGKKLLNQISSHLLIQNHFFDNRLTDFRS